MVVAVLWWSCEAEEVEEGRASSWSMGSGEDDTALAAAETKAEAG